MLLKYPKTSIRYIITIVLFILLVIGLTNHEIKYSNEVEKLKTEQNFYFFKSDVDVFLSMNKIITDGIDNLI